MIDALIVLGVWLLCACAVVGVGAGIEWLAGPTHMDQAGRRMWGRGVWRDEDR